MQYLRIALRVIGLLIAVTLNAHAKPTITVGYYEFPPISYTDDTGTATGSALNLSHTLLTSQGYDVVFKGLPSARLYAQLISGEVDLWLGSTDKVGLNGHVIESSKRISEVTLALYYHPSDPPPQLPSDLHNKSIITITGYSYWPPVTDWLADPALHIQAIRTSKHTSSIAMLLRKRGDYLLNYLQPMEDSKQQLGIAELKLPYLAIRTVPLTFIISKKSAYSKQLLEELESAYEGHQAARLSQHNR